MAYATGTASGPDDFITQLCAFAVTNADYTDQGTVTSSSGSGSRTVRRISKAGIWLNFVKASDSKAVCVAMAYSGLTAGTALPENPVAADAQGYFTRMGTWDFIGPYAGHYFFTDGTCVHAVLEVSTGIFNHMSFGKVTGFGTITGGEYVTGGWYQTYKPSGVWQDWTSAYCNRPFNDLSASNVGTRYTYLRRATAGVTADFQTCQGQQGSDNTMFVGNLDDGYTSTNSIYGRLLRDSPNAATNRTAIFPGLVRARDFASGLYYLMGSIPYVGILKMTPDMNAKDIINTDWQVFPITCRTGGDASVCAISYEYALAYRRV